MKASILAIGTELTAGQILNRNATTLSSQLKALGIEVVSHLTVPDDHDLILEALNFTELRSDLLFITGGLGPTSDDFTRDVVAQWAGLKMNFDEESWAHIQERITSRGFTVREMQKQQCYFPEGSWILFNGQGTAHGFAFRKSTKIVYVLPGPPREIEAIWQDHILHELKKITEGLNKLVTKVWDTLGTGESEVAFFVETALGGPRSEIGYRVHHPYVEVKISYFESDQEKFLPLVQKIEAALADITITRDFSDVAATAVKKIEKTDFTFYDFVTKGFLHSRVSPFLKTVPYWSFKQSPAAPPVDVFENEENFLALLPFDDDRCILLIARNGIRHQATLEAPVKAALMSERKLQIFAEKALIGLSRS